MVVEAKRSYEECRRQRLEENRKRMEELNLGRLAQALKASSPKPSPMKQAKRPTQPVDPSSVRVRRSSRVASKPPPNYKEGLPVQFCKMHLPHKDEMITLVDEDGNEFPTKYLAKKPGLSGGWRGFAIDHQLVDGDALVFQLIKPTTFKVFIIRVSELTDNEENDTNSDVSPLDRSTKRIKPSTK
ncbi:hypothetical protein I3843_06G136500 [Carya illinoinensis]|nr:hypothetical protein I3843_06G136500 [Carya illinoinensis]